MNPSPKGRIRIYTNVRHSLELARKIFEKHLADGTASPLYSIDDFSWDATGPKIGFCLEKHKEAINLTRAAEEMYRQRDAVLAEITDIIKATKVLLRNKYNTDIEKIAEWGFHVSDHAGVIEKSPP